MTQVSDSGFSGRALLGEWWYRCDICGTVVPGSRTTREVASREQRGYRVCDLCFDEPGRDDMQDEHIDRLTELARQEAEDHSKPA